MNSGNISIRKVEPKDAAQYVHLINSIWRVAYKHIFPEEVFVNRENEFDNNIKEFSNNFYTDNTRMCYVAEDNGIIVGAIYRTILEKL